MIFFLNGKTRCLDHDQDGDEKSNYILMRALKMKKTSEEVRRKDTWVGVWVVLNNKHLLEVGKQKLSKISYYAPLNLVNDHVPLSPIGPTVSGAKKFTLWAVRVRSKIHLTSCLCKLHAAPLVAAWARKGHWSERVIH